MNILNKYLVEQIHNINFFAFKLSRWIKMEVLHSFCDTAILLYKENHRQHSTAQPVVMIREKPI